ncbi:carbohydrate porin [Granulicella sp. WH15]|uniref:carbohydrate porin n=1 Tax=Granulicella sp. WH15 TaxID=2602070 RepID=UPI001366A67F|nr:carbohydrate porin [Granulicella sp. WH15]QHN03333.1 carbohydrate porin [Granulicella sp. WH15]
MTFSPTTSLLAALLLAAPCSYAQQQPMPDAPQPVSQSADHSSDQDASEPVATLFPHSDHTRYLILGQANIIFQAHGPFHSPYSGPNSLLGRGEYKTSMVGTLFLGFQLNTRPKYATDIIYDEESAGGRGISEALGLAGFTNLDVVRNPNLGSTPYLARVELHQVVGLSSKLTDTPRTPFSLATQLPERRLEFHVGKMGMPDFFDQNSIGTDSHLQFMNWTVDNNGAWDYAADTRGYTYGFVTEYYSPTFNARYGLALMPTVANGIDLEWNLRRARAQNFEFELHRGLLGSLLKPERKGVVRVLGFVNDANMGVYRDANKAFLAGLTKTPEVTDHAFRTTQKYGVGLNVEQEITPYLRAFGRFGWNEGQHESYAYTEVDDTYEMGADYSGRAFNRPLDKIGLTFVTNAIKKDHQTYLALGGKGFILGDGKLNYAREDTLEGYYNLHAWRGVFYALDLQYINHPGYNQDRGPVLVESVRMHVDF